MSLWFVTPAWQRFELSAVCFDQRVDVIRTLAAKRIEAYCVVVADDANLDLARERGFATVEQSNDGLGRRFNDGMEYAARQGATWIVPIGSDSWIDPAYFLGLHDRFVRTSRIYTVIEHDRAAELRVRTPAGAGPYVFPRRLLEPSGFRPAKDALARHIDSSTIQGIVASTGRPVPWSPSFSLHPYQYIGFRGTPTISPYATLKNRWGVHERPDPWRTLEAHYPSELVARVRKVLP